MMKAILHWVSLKYIQSQTSYIEPSKSRKGEAATKHRRSQYEANRGTCLGKILPNTVNFYFFYQTDNIRRFHTADFVQQTVCSPRLQFLPGYGSAKEESGEFKQHLGGNNVSCLIMRELVKEGFDCTQRIEQLDVCFKI